jgi:hypothetical protein
LPPVTMSWNKFSSEILPEVTSADIYIPAQTDIFSGLTTAVVPDAPPILMYDDPENRNTVTSYAVFSGKDERSGALIGLPPANWNLEMAKYHPLQAMVTGPHEWGNIPMPQFRSQVYFVIEGAYDKSLEAGKTGLMIFPVRSFLEGWEAGRLADAAGGRSINLARQCGTASPARANPDGDARDYHRSLGISNCFRLVG